MTLSLTHTFVSTVPDGADATVVRPSNWNDTHTIAGTLPIANGGTNSTATPTAGGIGYGTGTAHAYTAAGTTGQVLTSATAGTPTWTTPTTGTVTSVAQTFTGGIVSVAGSPITTSGTLALTVAGTAGGVPYFSSGSAWASTAAGTTGQYLKSNGASAPTWADASTVYTKTTFTATAGQTTFTVNYTVGYVDVFLNGVKLTVSDYTASNGTSVVLGVAAALNDIVETLSWTVWSVTNTAIGAGTGTSLALNGATLGANALAVTGTAAFSGAITTTTQSAADNSTKVATTAYVDRAAAVPGNYVAVYKTTASNYTIPANATASSVFKFTLRGGGGGGGSGTTSGNGGGGQGGKATYIISGLSASSTVTVTSIGAGGAHDADGGTTSITVNGVTVTATGGKKGVVATNISGTVGGVGGTTTNATISEGGQAGGTGASGTNLVADGNGGNGGGQGGGRGGYTNNGGTNATDALAPSAGGGGGSGGAGGGNGGSGAGGDLLIEGWL